MSETTISQCCPFSKCNQRTRIAHVSLKYHRTSANCIIDLTYHKNVRKYFANIVLIFRNFIVAKNHNSSLVQTIVGIQHVPFKGLVLRNMCIFTSAFSSRSKI